MIIIEDTGRIDKDKLQVEYWTDKHFEGYNLKYRQCFNVELRSSGEYSWINSPCTDRHHELEFEMACRPYMSTAITTYVPTLPSTHFGDFVSAAMRIIAEYYILSTGIGYYEWLVHDKIEGELYSRLTIRMHQLKVVQGKVKTLHGRTRKALKKPKPLDLTEFHKFFKKHTFNERREMD